MKKICLLITAAFLGAGIASADTMDIMTPASSPLMQTIQNNTLDRKLPDELKKQKAKEENLEKLKKETLKELTGENIKIDEEKKQIPENIKTKKTRAEKRAEKKAEKARIKAEKIQKKKDLKLAKEQQKAAEKALKEQKKQIKKLKKTNPELAGKMEIELSHIKDEKPLILVKYQQNAEQTKDAKLLDEELKDGKFNLKANKDTNTGEVKIYIKKVEFSPSEIFTEDELQEMAKPLINETVTMTDIKNLVDKINRSYIINDYVTSRAYLPEQKIEDGKLTINLFEGRVGEVLVKGNTWTRKSYITKRLGLQEGELFRLRVLENSLIKFNNDHYNYTKNPFALKARLAPGKEQGTTDILVDTNDPLPFRLTGVFDNAGRDTIGLLRGGVMASTESLTGNRDRLSLGSYFGKGTQIYFGDYNIPINKYGTRAGVSVSYNHIDVIKGPYRDFDISGNAMVYTAYISHPIINRPDLTFTSYTAGNFKTTNTYFSDVPIYRSKTASGTQGFTLRKDTKRGIWYTGHYASVGYMDTIPAHDIFWKYNGNLTRLHDFGHGIIGQFRAAVQVSPNKELPWIEQFQIGGISSVRGYSEGLLIGRSGYFMSAELITPIPLLPKKVGTEKLGFINPREIIKLALFFDQGCVFPYKGVGGGHGDSSDVLMSIGPGLRIRLSDYLNARIYWGFSMIQNRYETKQPTGRFHFELTSSPDLDKLLKARKPKSEKL